MQPDRSTGFTRTRLLGLGALLLWLGLGASLAIPTTASESTEADTNGLALTFYRDSVIMTGFVPTDADARVLTDALPSLELPVENRTQISGEADGDVINDALGLLAAVPAGTEGGVFLIDDEMRGRLAAADDDGVKDLVARLRTLNEQTGRRNSIVVE